MKEFCKKDITGTNKIYLVNAAEFFIKNAAENAKKKLIHKYDWTKP